MRGGRESSFNRLDVFGLGLKGLYCGPIGLDLGEAQGPFNEIQVDLGRVSKPNDLNGFKRYNKGMMDVGCGPVEADAKGEGAFLGDEAPISLSRAQSEPSINKERGASGDNDPLIGLSMMAFEMVERGLLTNEALRKEASKYVESLFFLVGGRVLSSSPPSDFGQAVLNKGSFGGLASVVNGEE